MEELKVALLKIGKEKGDNGDTELQKVWINNFLDSVLKYLTPEGVLTFTPLDLRCLYILWLRKHIETGSSTLCDELVASHLELAMEPRQIVVQRPPEQNVASIFEKKS